MFQKQSKSNSTATIENFNVHVDVCRSTFEPQQKLPQGFLNIRDIMTFVLGGCYGVHRFHVVYFESMALPL